METESPAATKHEMRKTLKALRGAVPEEDRSALAERACSHFLGAYGHYDTFLVYSSIRSEMQTEPIIRELLKRGKTLLLPRVEGEDIAAVPYGETKTGSFGIQEPSGKAFAGDPDVCVVPLLGINAEGYRIGYGKGFYDRYLKTHRCLSIGLGYSFQMVAFVQDPWDEPLDAFVSEDGVISCKR